MSNDDNTFSAMLTLVASGAAGYAAGRWLVEPWLLASAARPLAAASLRRSLAAVTASSYVGPSGDTVPIDPYGDGPLPATVTAPNLSALAPSVLPHVSSPASAPMATYGPTTSPSQADSSPGASVASNSLTPSSFTNSGRAPLRSGV